MEAEAGPSFCKWWKVGTSCKKLKETEIHEILGTEDSDEEYSRDTDYSYEVVGVRGTMKMRVTVTQKVKMMMIMNKMTIRTKTVM
jgi:hypothetical protein